MIKNIESVVKDLCDWIKDYVDNNGANGVVLGMSGGLDCITVARLCQIADIPCDAINIQNGNHIMPSESLLYLSSIDQNVIFISATEVIGKISTSVLGEYKVKNHYEDCYEGYGSNLNMAFANVAPRVRMTILYMYAQLTNRFVIGTSNLSELYTGYFTKWGDGAADFEPLAQFTKTEVREIAKFIGVDQSILDLAPSADLWEGQTDEGEMGLTYRDIDAVIRGNEMVVNEVRVKISRKTNSTSHKRNPVPEFKYSPK